MGRERLLVPLLLTLATWWTLWKHCTTYVGHTDTPTVGHTDTPTVGRTDTPTVGCTDTPTIVTASNTVLPVIYIFKP